MSGPVLVVDDSEGIRESVSDLLRSAGYSVLQAADTESAIEMLRANHVGALLLDIRMPGGGGLVVLESLDTPPPVILMSAFPLNEEEQRWVDDRIFVHLVKPFHPRRLLDAVSAAIGRPGEAPASEPPPP